jgi:hypothetical protein
VKLKDKHLRMISQTTMFLIKTKPIQDNLILEAEEVNLEVASMMMIKINDGN